MQKEEREFVLRHLADSRERLIQAVDGLSEEQRYFRSAEDRWSIAECVEHITITEGLFFKKVQEAAQAPPQSGSEEDVRSKDQLVLERVPARDVRLKGPAELMPTGRWPEFEELIRQFEATRERTLRFAAVTQADLRNHFMAHPALGTMDCYQYLLLFAAHCERHVRQMEEVQRDRGFPGHMATSA